MKFCVKASLKILVSIFGLVSLLLINVFATSDSGYDVVGEELGGCYGYIIPTDEKLTAQANNYSFSGDFADFYFMVFSIGKENSSYKVEIYSSDDYNNDSIVYSYTSAYGEKGSTPINLKWKFGDLPSGCYYGKCYTQIISEGVITIDTSSICTFDIDINRDYLTFELQNDCYAIIDCVNNITGTVEIPDVYNGLPVTTITSYAFSGCKNITNILIHNSITSIQSSAFENCTALTSITIPYSVQSIGSSAFNNCISLESVAILPGVKSIGEDAFSNTAYYNDSNNWENDVLYIGNYLIKAKDTISGEYEIKDGTKIIAENAFFDCTSLTSVTIPDSVTSIGHEAFCNCTSLDSITIPDSVIITSSVFYNTGYYNDINNWKNGVLYLDNHLVKAKDTLSGVYTIKTGIKYIDGNAFSDCNMLESVVIPNSVTYIGPWAFYNCESLVNITIPETVTNIEDHAFCSCKKLVNVTLPAGVKSIGFMAFNACFSLSNLTLPQSLNTIDNAAFEFCEKLEYIFYEGTSTEWENLKIGSFNEKLTMAKIHYNSTGHSHSCSMERAPTEQENGKAIDTCPVCGFINGEEDILYINDHITAVDTKNAVVDTTRNTLVLDMSACQDITEAIVEMDGYTLTTTPTSSYGFIGTGSKLQVADSTGTQVAEYTLVVRGDVNGDSVCDVLDCMLLELARHESNNVSLEGVYFAAGNLAEDNEINIDDFNAVVNKALALA